MSIVTTQIYDRRMSRMSFDSIDSTVLPLSKPSIANDLSGLQNIELSWHDVNYSVITGKAVKSEKKVILEDMNGVMRSGEVTALMGPSGAGKSSLMNIIAGRSIVGDASGSIKINDRAVSRSDYKDLVAFVPQDDVFLPFLTVRETIQYAADLKLDARMKAQDRAVRIEQIMQELGLEECQDAIVGNAMIKGISGGQRKRLAIAS